MSRRDIIAVIVGKGKDMLKTNMISGIIAQAKALGYNVALFSLFAISDNETSHLYGEANIYTLLNNKRIVGAIVVDYSLHSDYFKDRVYNILKRLPADRIAILDSGGVHGYEGFMTEDELPMEILTDHLIEEHDCKDIICLTGPMQHEVSRKRLQGFINSLKKHDIPVDSDRIIEGDFWIGAATKLAADIADGSVPMPDGVVCCNFKMTNILVNELENKGIIVPEQFPVVGFDFTQIDSMNNNLRVTIHTRDELSLGARCVCYIHKGITGEAVEPQIKDTGRLIIGDSCGCKKRDDYFSKIHENQRENTIYLDLFYISFMQQNLMSASDIKSLLHVIPGYIYLVKNLISYDLCLNENWSRFSENDEYKIIDGYEEKLVNVFSFNNNHTEYRNTIFSLEELLPPSIDDSDNPVACFFTPIHFGDRCAGYQIAQFKDDIYNTAEDVFNMWTSGLSVALEYMRIKEHMELMYNKVYATSIRDNMTGLYNRRAYDVYKNEVFNHSIKNKNRLLFASVDMNNLKAINDTYGHIEGDNAIVALANAINTCCGNNEYALRVGGDEFIILGCYDYHDNTPQFYTDRIRGYLERYNKISEKPYEVSASVGVFFDYAENYSSIEECAAIADELMYKDKLESKKGRK